MNHSHYLGTVRADTLDAIDRYVTDGIPTGIFCEAVLENKLMEAFGRADMGNREALFHICEYVYNETPAACHGSPEKVRAWLRMKQEERQAKQTSCQCSECLKGYLHRSDCAVHNEPAYPNGACDCNAVREL